MRRRGFVALAGAAILAWPAGAAAQSRAPDRRWRIGLILIGDAPPTRDLEIVKDLARLGYEDGRNVDYVVASGREGSGGVAGVMRELVAAKLDVAVGPGSALAYALADAAPEIPIVMTAIADPIDIGLSASMSHPTGHVTGFTLASASIASKRLELLHQLLPKARKVGHLWVPARPHATQNTAQAKRAADQLGIELVSLPVASGAEIAAAFAKADDAHVEAMMTDPDPVTVQFDVALADECLIRSLPLVDCWPSLARNGAVMAYGPPEVEHFKAAADYVDRILKGAKVADLPFVEPTQVTLTVNLQVARSIGLSVPANLLALADEVIE